MTRSQTLRSAFERIFPGSTEHQYNQAEEVVYTTIESLMGLDEVTRRFGLKKSAANMRVWRNSKSFPPPDVKLKFGSFWFGEHVEAFIAENPDTVRHHVTEEESDDR